VPARGARCAAPAGRGTLRQAVTATVELARKAISAVRSARERPLLCFLESANLRRTLSSTWGDAARGVARPGHGACDRLASMWFAAWGEPVVVLSTHMDTVPRFLASSEDDEHVHGGRGVCDTKGWIAAMIHVLRRSSFLLGVIPTALLRFAFGLSLRRAVGVDLATQFPGPASEGR
jgi:acetylornithine deacetylase/succinyl-diaminopimelate desuccinylase-like protein